MRRFQHCVRTLALTCAIGASLASSARADKPLTIRVVDEQTGRGIPLVELTTTNGIAYHTDSAGVVAFDEPGLMGGKVFFSIDSPGYHFPKDGFGSVGKAVLAEPGSSFTFKMKRTQIAQRLYRITGQGIYHHSARAGLPLPLPNANLNGRVMGQDTAMAMPYKGKLHWFWGDTGRPGYPLGNFGTSGATAPLPGPDGTDPNVGIPLTYFVDDTGFSRPMFQLGRPGVVWVHGGTVLPDPDGQPRIVFHYARLRTLGETLEHGIAAFNDEKKNMAPVAAFPLDAPVHPFGQTVRHTDNGVEYVYFCTPYALTRVRATWEAYADWKQYEAWTPLKTGTRRIDFDNPDIERDDSGRPVHAWRKATAPLKPGEQQRLVQSGKLRREHAWIQTVDADSGKPVVLHTGSIRRNPYRKKWIMIAVRAGAPESYLGEVYYAEAPSLHGPWPKAIKVATHPKYTYYNPVHHDFLDLQDGRLIHFEGTYTKTFSGNPVGTPRYDYNQLMYRVDLADPRIEKTFGPR